MTGIRVDDYPRGFGYVGNYTPSCADSLWFRKVDGAFQMSRTQIIPKGTPKPIDGGFYLFTAKEKEMFIEKEPAAEKWFRPWIGSHEFINGYYRYCLCLGDCSPSELKQMTEAVKRVEAVRVQRERH